MKKRFLIVALIVLVLVGGLVLIGCATTPKGSDFRYQVTTNGIRIDGLRNSKDTPSRIIIPAQIEGLPVISIGGNRNRWGNLWSITMPDSVLYILNGAFEDCFNLGLGSNGTVIIPNSVIDIGESAFEGCKEIKNITISSGVTRIRRRAFEGCDALISVTFERNDINIDTGAFPGNLVTVYMSENGGAGTYTRARGTSHNIFTETTTYGTQVWTKQ